MVVGTIRVAAMGSKRPHITKQSGKFRRYDIPELKLPYARCVDDRGRLIDPKPRCGRCGVLAFLIIEAHGLDALCKSGDQVVEDTRLSDAALTDHGGAFSLGPRSQKVHAPASHGADHQGLVAHLRVASDKRLESLRIDQVAFIDAYGCLDLILLGGRQDPIDQIRFDSRFCSTRHHEDLVDIRGDDMPAILARAAQFGNPWLDADNPTLVARLGFDPNPVPGHHDVPLGRREVL